MNIDIAKLNERIKKPMCFEKGTSQMWVDDYISQQMLIAHFRFLH